jgi:hypothetical protein
MVYTILVRLQVGMFAHSSSLNLCKSKERKHFLKMKFYNGEGDRPQMELE